MKKFIFLALALGLSVVSYGIVKLPTLLSDNMILQRDKPIVIWGWAAPNEKITVQFKDQTKKGTTDKSGKWKVILQPEAAGGPFQLVVQGKNTITVNNVLIGEVWICSGQSNMEWPVSSTNNAEAEIKQGNFPEIRQFLVQKAISAKPEEDVAGDWKSATTETVGNFTAVGYFFARELYNKLKIPIGLINTSWGGTHSETWTSREAFEQSAEFKDMIATMPAVDLEKLNREKTDAQMKKLSAMGISLPAQGVAHWKELSFNDSQWRPMRLPGLWEQQGLSDLDGVIWFRKSLNIENKNAGKDAVLELSMIDDSDETFINGEHVGATNAKYNEKRKYAVPSGLLKSGANVIAVRVHDTGGGGGIYGDAQEMKLTLQGGEVMPLAGNWAFMVEEVGGSTSIGPNSFPTLLFNAMINPLLNARIAGVLWYQGESNAGRAYQYRTAFPLLIQDWRKHWKQGDFPFYYVQLASFNADNGTSEHGSTWAELREAQTMTLTTPHTGMVVTTDIGQANDIHPRNKQDVGKRLASIALHNEYGQNIVSSGPVYQSMRVDGDNIRVSFTNTGTGLMAKDKYGYLKGFEIAGPDKNFHYAKAWIEGNDVVVSATQVHGPVAVRFAWADNPEDANLYNNEGFPALPFRTDNWKGITTDSKFSIE